MPKTVFGGTHKILVETLVQARKAANLTQTELAIKLGKDQKFISLIESSRRRVDVLEFFALSRALGRDPEDMFSELSKKLPDELDI